MNIAEMIGYAAGFLTTTAFIPQVIKCWRSRHTRDISFPFTMATATGLALWLMFGIYSTSIPIIVANGLTLGLVLTLLYLKIRYH